MLRNSCISLHSCCFVLFFCLKSTFLKKKEIRVKLLLNGSAGCCRLEKKPYQTLEIMVRVDLYAFFFVKNIAFFEIFEIHQ